MGKHLKKPVSFRLSDDEMERFETQAARHGGKTAAFLAGLTLLEGANGPSIEDAIAILAAEHGFTVTRKRKR